MLAMIVNIDDISVNPYNLPVLRMYLTKVRKRETATDEVLTSQQRHSQLKWRSVKHSL